MKTLDVQALHKAIDQTLEQLKHQSVPYPVPSVLRNFY